jgi:N-sulfoglucosamine sulfohydrolase
MNRKILFFIISSQALIFSACRKEIPVEEKVDSSRRISFDPTLRLGFKPNIVWLVTDDLGPIIPAFGDSTVETPNLNRLAAEGVRFTNLFSTSATGGPGRCTLMTGMYPASIGGHNDPVRGNGDILKKNGLIPYEVVPPPEVKMVSQLLRENGYYCSNNAGHDPPFTPPATAWDDNSLKAHWKNRKPGQPFFAVFNFDVTSEDYVTLPYKTAETRFDDPGFPDININNYSPDKAIAAEDWKLNVPQDLNVSPPAYLPPTQIVKKDLRRVYSNLLNMDRQAGIILEQLKSAGLLDSTIVFWFSENGGPMPRQKRSLYDGGIHIPMIIRFPAKKAAGTFDDDLISLVDFTPTLLSVAGIRIPEYVQGLSFLGRFRNDRPRKYIFAASDRIETEIDMTRAVRDKQYKYFQNFFPERPYYLPIPAREKMATMKEMLRRNKSDSLNDAQSEWFSPAKPADELFDTWKDPYELHNIAGDTAYRAILSELRSACVQWMNESNDMGLTPESDIINLFWPGRKQLKTENIQYTVKDQKVFFTCDTEGAGIGYQVIPLDSLPGLSWAIYKDPIKIKPDIRIIAIAHRIGFAASDTLKIEFR